jgi:hypothetical protein
LTKSPTAPVNSACDDHSEVYFIDRIVHSPDV